MFNSRGSRIFNVGVDGDGALPAPFALAEVPFTAAQLGVLAIFLRSLLLLSLVGDRAPDSHG